jgi:nucleoside-diphosphate-sugar epimerase
MRIGLLGAGGFIGSNLSRFLIDAGEHEIIGIDLWDDKLVDCIDAPNFEFVQGNIEDAELVNWMVNSVDVVVDLVAYANPSLYVQAPLDVYNLNFEANMAVARACVRHKKRLIQYSTAEVYGKPMPGETAYAEDESPLIYGPVHKQRWIYAAAKQLLERVIHAYGLKGDLDYTIIRPFNFIGPRLDYLVPPATMGGPRVFPHFMSALLSNGPMFLVDGGQALRSFTHIEDASEAFAVLLEHPGARGQAFNIGNPGNNTSIHDLAVTMKRLFGEIWGRPAGSELIEVSGERFYGEGYEDNGRVPPSVDKLRALGWQPKRNLETTLRDAMQFYHDNPQPVMSPEEYHVQANVQTMTPAARKG